MSDKTGKDARKLRESMSGAVDHLQSNGKISGKVAQEIRSAFANNQSIRQFLESHKDDPAYKYLDQ